MAEHSKIGWCDHTLNAWIGCSKVAAGCDHCYAEGLSRRYGFAEWGPGQPRRPTAESTWFQYRKWEKRAARTGVPELVFCGSLMDWCDLEAPIGGLWRIHQAWRETPHLIWLMLTKRVPNIERCLPADWGEGYRNVALGYSLAEAKDLAQMDCFAAIPARWLFISYEPAIEWCELRPWLFPDCPECNGGGLIGCVCEGMGVTGSFVDQVIIGGESGPKARSFDIGWAHRMVDLCQEAGVRCFVKQLGAKPVVGYGGNGKAKVLLRHPKGEDPAEWPSRLRVQEQLVDTE